MTNGDEVKVRETSYENYIKDLDEKETEVKSKEK